MSNFKFLMDVNLLNLGKAQPYLALVLGCHQPNAGILSFPAFRSYLLGNSSAGVQFIPAGAVLPKPSQASNANACSFAVARRPATVGGALIATVADLPKPSVYVRLSG